MYSMKEVVGEYGQLSARLCTLGWTAVGKINGTESIGLQHTGFHHTFRSQQEGHQNKGHQAENNLDEMLKQFWDLESIGITHKETSSPAMSPEENIAWSKVSESMHFNGHHYEVAVPWREDRPKLPPNGSLAKR